MAVVKYGTIVTELKGSIAGQVFQAGNKCKVLRNKGYRAGTRSVARQAVTSRLSVQTTRWRSLSDSERSAWLAANTDWPFTDKYGDTYYGSGFQYFTACNIALVSIQQMTVDAPPTPVSYEAITPSAGEVNTSNECVFNIDATTTLSQTIQCYATAPMSQGNSGNNVRYYYIGNFNSSTADQLVDTTVYVSLFGTPPVGALVMLKMVVRPVAFPRIAQTVIQRVTVTS